MRRIKLRYYEEGRSLSDNTYYECLAASFIPRIGDRIRFPDNAMSGVVVDITISFDKKEVAVCIRRGFIKSPFVSSKTY